MSADMNTDKSLPTSVVDAQVQRLLEIVADYQQQQCSALLDQAQRQSQHIIRQAYRNARLRLHHDIQDRRQQMQQELAAAHAKQHTLLMQQRYRADQEFLNQAWELLAEKLRERWRDPQQRQLWVQSVIAAALKVLPGQQWEIAHPQDWPQAERDNFKKTVNSRSGLQISFNSEPAFTAGIRISADGAVADGTLQGLMADRGRIESEILAQCRDGIVQNHGG
jgi:F0F1-type ATP synthase membrane subunit b/b'